jgi:hypothetical protein
MHLPTTNLRRHVWVLVVIRTTRRLLRSNSWCLRIRWHGSQPAQYSTSRIDCTVFALGCSAHHAKEPAAAPEHNPYHENSYENQAENYRKHGGQE